MWIECNPNPCRLEEPDCVVRAIAIATDRDWHTVHRELCEFSGWMCSMPSVNRVWKRYLEEKKDDTPVFFSTLSMCGRDAMRENVTGARKMFAFME